MSAFENDHSPFLQGTPINKSYFNTTKLMVDPRDIFSSDIFVKKGALFDFGNQGGSLCDLETPCNGFTNMKDSYLNSMTSTNDGSRLSLDCKTFTRLQSLEVEAPAGGEEEKLKMMTSPEKQSPLLYSCFEYGCREMDACSEIIEKSEEDIQNQSLSSARFMNEEDVKLEENTDMSVSSEPPWMLVHPRFSLDKANAPYYALSDDKRTITHHSNTRFSTIYAEEPLPSSGKCQFSIRVENCTKTNPKLYVGIAANNLVGQKLSYKHGFYFLNAFSKESYLNELKVTKESALPKKGQVIRVSIDMDCATISFELEDKVVLEGKIYLPKGKLGEFYPCIALGELEGSVSFLCEYP